jgi:putative DNA primase/helicase
VVAPVFGAERGDKATDFNDLHQAEGLDRVRQQLEAALEKCAPAPPATAGKGGGKKKPRASDDPRAGWLLDRYTYIYPTSTAWDAKIEEIVPIGAMRNMFGDSLVKWWLEHDERRTVLAKDVDFMPGAAVTDDGPVNLFRGVRSKPSKAGSCERLLELLLYLCNGEREVYDWVLRWAAFPLHHLGAKMRTAVVMHGPEGTGKNLFWGAVAKAYEPYSGLVTQFQVQSQFNDWISRKLFVVANEVVTRMELKHLKGYVKNLITEERVPIETKNMPVRMEANHMQIVFLSNELLPLHISPGDRRFMVIRTPPELGADYYAEVGAELAAGGAERLHWHLLHEVTLGEFNEHSKPLMTEAKRDLIELGLSSAQLFWRELHDGLLPLPYAPALSEDLYRAYITWCQRNGERNPAKINTFSAEFRAMNGVTRKVCRVAVGMEQDPRQRTCFLMQSPEAADYSRAPGEDDDRWATRTVSVFRDQLGEFLKGGAS